MCLEGCMTFSVEALIVTYHLAKFNGHILFCSEDITNLVWHVTLQDHLIKGSCDFMKGSPSLYVTILPSLVTIGDNIFKLSCDLVRPRDQRVL